jgi:hypothetical protein
LYAGHLAAGLALKAAEPKAPTWGLLLAVGFMDSVLFGPFVLLGIEHASITPGVSPGFSLDYIDWSHSLAMSVVWSVLLAIAFLRMGKSVAAVIGVAVFSHFVLDVLMHPPDLALWPNSSVHLGLGLWTSLPNGWWVVELAVVAAGWGYYAWKSRGSPFFGGHPLGVAAALLVFHLLNSPWLSAL